MRTLLFTVLVSFNLVACVTGDNADDFDMPAGEITAGQQDDMVDQDVTDEDAQLRPSREVVAPANELEQSPSAMQQTAGANGAQPALEAVIEKRPVRDDRVVPETNGQLEQDGQLPKLVEDTALETLTDEELEQLEQDARILPGKRQAEVNGQLIDANLPAIR